MSSLLRYRIKGLHLINVREFEDVKLNFEDGINMLQIRNGYGKSTILEILQWAYTGSIPENHGIQYKRDFISPRPEKSEVQIDFEISDDDNILRDWKLTMWFDHSNNTSGFRTKSPEAGGDNNGWKLPANFRSRFKGKKKFTNMFVFDGELAKQLKNDQDSEQIESALRDLTGLRNVYYHVNDNGHLENHKSRKFNENSINNPQKAIQSYNAALTKAKTQLLTLKDREAEIKTTIKEKDGELQQLTETIDNLAEQQDKGPELKEIRKKLKNSKDDLKELTNDLLIALGNPANIGGKFWSIVKDQNSDLAKRKIPEGVGRTFFKELLESENCICGVAWDAEGNMKQHLRDNQENYLDDDIMTIIKSMQSHVGENSGTEDLSELKETILNKQIEVAELKTEENEVSNSYDKDSIEKHRNLKEQQSKLESKIDELKEELDEITTTDPQVIKNRGWERGAVSSSGEAMLQHTRFKDCKNKFTINKIIRALEKKVADSEPLEQLRLGTQITREVILDALENVMSKARKRVQKRTNELLSNIPGTGGGLQVVFDSNKIKFQNEFGEEQEDANMGAVLSAAYCFVASMSELGSVDSVLVADSPVTGMDNKTSGGWTSEIWPMFNQSIYIITPGERLIIGGDRKGKVNLYGSGVNYQTVFRENEWPDGENQSGLMQVKLGVESFSQYAVESDD